MRILIVQEAEAGRSETFIRAHGERLAGKVTVAHGLLPQLNGRRVLQPSLLSAGRLAYHTLRGIWPATDLARWATTLGYAEVLRQIKPDVVLAEYGLMAVQVRQACQQAGVPLVAHFHGYDASQHAFLENFNDDLSKLFTMAAAIVVVSQSMRERLISFGAPSDKLRLNYYGVDLDRFQGADPANAAPVFLAVGRFVEKKGPHLTLAAFQQVRQHCPAAELRMIGEGPLLGVCKDLARTLHMESGVTFLGSQPHESVQAEMQKARAFVQHSMEAADGDCEGTPVAILEASAAGLPVVSTKHAGIPDVVLDGVTGFLSAERDVSSMAQSMIRLADDGPLAAAIGAAGRQRVADHFTMDRSISELQRILAAAASVAEQGDRAAEHKSAATASPTRGHG